MTLPDDPSPSAPPWERIALEGMREGVVLHDATGAIVGANPRACEVLGLTWEQLRGLVDADPRWSLIRRDGTPLPPDEIPSVEVLATGNARSGVVLGVALPDGRRRWLSVCCVPLVAQSGGIEGAVATFLDVTEALSLEEERDHLFACAPDVLCVASISERRFVRVNPAFTRILGYDADEAIRMDPLTLVASSYRTDAQRFLAKLAKAGRLDEVEIPHRCQNGVERVLSWSFRRAIEGSDLVYGSARDVTDAVRRRAEVETIAYRDSVTGLSSVAGAREVFSERTTLGPELAAPVAVIVLDFDHWQPLADAFGLDAGNRLLCDLADRLVASLPDALAVARIERARFVALTTAGLDGELEAREASLVEAFAHPFTLPDAMQTTFRPCVGIDVAGFPWHDSLDTHIAHAELALAEARATSGTRVRRYGAASPSH